MEFSFYDILNTLPFTILMGTALLVVLADSLLKRAERISFWLCAAGLGSAGIVALFGTGSDASAYSGMLSTGGFADFLAALFALSGFLSLLLSRSFLVSRTDDSGEYYVLLLFAVGGMILIAAAADLIVLFLGIELMSLSFYVLAGFTRTSVISNEASLKYFLLGAFATGFLLYGIALVYGVTGSTSIMMASPAATNSLFLVGLTLLLIGLLFKIAAVPFHMWVPDVYEGSPTPVSGFMSTGGKAAAFSGILLVFSPSLLDSVSQVREALAVIAALSMIAGNIFALAQQNVKRMLAYSSIAHAGYILTGVVAANQQGMSGVLFYLLAYILMNAGAFGVVAFLEKEGEKNEYDRYAGLGSTNPILAGLMALFMFSLTGIPPFAGFFAKYSVFAGAVGAGYTWLAIVGVLASLVSVYYYLRLVVVMYFRPSSQPLAYSPSLLSYLALILSAVALIVFGVLPSSVLDVTTRFF
jgi:NADH-quinone oxidoreductase subunit N